MARTSRLLDLVKLVPSGDIGRAAEALGLTPMALLKRLENVEPFTGLKLLGKAPKGIKPTEAGRLVMDHASRIFSQARDLTRDLEELAGLQSPELNFGTDLYAAEMPLGVALGRMASANPRLRVHAAVGDFEDLSRSVLAGKLDFAIADTTSAERHPTRLAIEPVAEHRVFFFVRADHPLAREKAPKLETILTYPLVTTRLPQRMAVHLTREMPLARVDRETGDLLPSLAVESFSVVKAVVLSGDAVALTPLSAIASELRTERVRLLRFDAPWLHLSYGLFYLRKHSLSRASQLFVTQLRQVETDIQEREQKALARMAPARRSSARRPAAKQAKQAKPRTAAPARRASRRKSR